MRISVAAFSLMAVLTAACGAGSQPASDSDPGDSTVVTTPPDSTGSSSSLEAMDQPPDLIVTAGDDGLVLSPFSYCWSSGGQGVCADGAAPDPLPSLTVDNGEDLTVEFPLDWQLQATLLLGSDYCEGSLTLDIDAGSSSVEALGPAGTYRVDVFGRGEQGDGAWAFEVTTTEDRPSPPLYIQVLWYPSGRDLDAEAPFSAYLGNLTSKPNDVSAVATVTSSNGSSQDFELFGVVDENCWSSTRLGRRGSRPTVTCRMAAPKTSSCSGSSTRTAGVRLSSHDVEVTVNVDDWQITTPAMAG